MASVLLLLANESKEVPCFLWHHGHRVDHQILENPVIHIKMIDLSFRETKIIWCAAIPVTPIRFLVFWCSTSCTKPNSCQRPEGPAVLQALSPLAVVQMEGAPTLTPFHGCCRVEEEKGDPLHASWPWDTGARQPDQSACCKKAKRVRIITSGHIFTGMEAVSSEIALKCTGSFCSFPGGWRLFGWKRVPWLNEYSGAALKVPSPYSPTPRHATPLRKFSIPTLENVTIFEILPTPFV